jgi:hypothetical protein
MLVVFIEWLTHLNYISGALQLSILPENRNGK